jgi:hypothetical protein
VEYLTCYRGDRIGMNVYARLITMSFCHNNSSKYIYVHTPLPEPFESMFNLGMGCMRVTSAFNIHGRVNPPPFPTDLTPHIQWKREQLKCAATKDCEQLPNFSDEFKRDIIQRYKPFSQKDGGINICIHMRRGDTADLANTGNQFKRRRSSDDFLGEVFQKINEFIKKPANITVHSDSALDMEKFETYGLKINTNFECAPEEAMRDMISCDILFRSGLSSFSGVCAFYNENLIISDMPDGYEDLYAAKNTYALKDSSRRLKLINKKPSIAQPIL